MSDFDSQTERQRSTIYTVALTVIILARLMVSAAINPAAGYLNNAALAVLLVPVLFTRPGRLSFPPLLRAGMVLYLAAALISVPFSIMPADSLRWALLHLGDLLLLIAIAAVRPNRAVLFAILTGAGLITAAYALRQHYGGFARTLAAPGVSDYARETLGQGRVFGLTFSPDMLAAVLAGILPVVLDKVRVEIAPPNHDFAPDRNRTAVYIIVTAIFLAALYFTRSVGGLAAAAAGIALWAVMAFQLTPARIGKRRFAAITAATTVLITAAVLGSMLARGGHLLDTNSRDNPLLKRLDNWTTAIKVWTEFPITGAGAGQYGLAMFQHRTPAGNEAKHVHNTLIEILAETGPLGMAGAALIIAGFAVAGFQIWTRHNFSPPSEEDESRVFGLTPGLFAGGLAVALHSMIDFDWTVPEVVGIFWIAAALTGRGPRPVGSSRTRPVGSSRTRMAVAAALVVTAGAELYQAGGEWRFQDVAEAARDGKWLQARALADRALDLDRTRDETYAILAQALVRTDPAADPIWPIRRAIALNPRNPYYQRDLAFVLLPKDPAAADRAFQKAVELYPNSLDLNLIWGRRLLETSRYPEAEPVLLHAVDCHWSNAEPLLELGRLYVMTGRENQASEAFNRAAPSRHLLGARALAVAEWLERQNQKNIASRFLTAWLDSHPSDPNRARVAAAANRYQNQ